MLVQLKFRPYFRDRMLSGAKTATTRTKRMGYAGDAFEAFGAVFKFVGVTRMKLQKVASGEYQKEGFTLPHSFVLCWLTIHPRKGYDPNQVVWFHEFKKVEAS